MINLLSTEQKRLITAARHNVILSKYLVMLVGLASLVVAAYGVGYFILDGQKATYLDEINQYKPQRAAYANTLKQSAAFSKNLSIARLILNNEIGFSNLLTDVAVLLPAQTVLAEVHIKASDLTKPVEFSFYVANGAQAIDIKTAFEKSAYFTNTSIRLIEPVNNKPYPYHASLTTTIDKVKYIESNKEKTDD